MGTGWNLVYEVGQVRLELVDLVNVVDVRFGDGTAQRSRVDQILVTFDGQVDIDSSAFSLLKRGASGGLVTNSFTTQTDTNGNTIATITFSGARTRATGALVDGYYQLTIDSSKVRRAGTQLLLDGNNDGILGGNYQKGTSEVDRFFALYGDMNGDGLVSLPEFNQFRSAFGKLPGASGYNKNLDFDGGGVSLSDFNQFRNRFGKPKLPWE